MNRPTLLLTVALIVGAAITACGGDTASEGDATATATDQPPAAASPTIQPSEAPTTASPSPATATPTSVANLDYAAYYAENCASCHGQNRGGVGRTPALTPDALTDDIAEYLDETDDRTHASIWSRTEFSDDQRHALIEYLATTNS